MTPVDLDAVEARITAATPGPWRDMPMGSDGSVVLAGGDTARTARRIGRCGEFADADLIAHAPEDLAALVAEVERLRAVTEAARALIPAGDSDSLTEYAIAWADLRAALDALDAGGEG